jgi:class 3 adenylate cyclase
MNLDKFNELLLESVGVGLAILRPDDLQIMFRNRRFSEWFPDARVGESTLKDLIADLDESRLRERIEQARPYTASTELRVKRRVVSLSFTVSRPEDPDSSFLVAECQNISKIKELEYMIESYSKMVEKQNRKLEREKERAEKLLLNVMPRKVYEEIKAFGVTTPQRFDEASILMLDFVEFTKMAVAQDPTALIAELNDIFTSFDQIAEQFGCERIKTIGDAYMAVCGVPESVPDHAQSIAKVALLFVRYLQRRNEAQSIQWRCRIGINSGPVIGSIVGIQKYVYDIFGPGVNLAARMEALSDAMEITLCEDMYEQIRTDYRFEDRGELEVKGFGKKHIYTLLGEGPARRPSFLDIH